MTHIYTEETKLLRAAMASDIDLAEAQRAFNERDSRANEEYLYEVRDKNEAAWKAYDMHIWIQRYAE